jgi:hypothetical protein
MDREGIEPQTPQTTRTEEKMKIPPRIHPYIFLLYFPEVRENPGRIEAVKAKVRVRP